MSDTVNPIISGFAPDPSVVLVGDWFYLVNSSFHAFPGLPIYASQDLLSWKQIGNAIHRQSQLSLAKSQANLYPVDDGKFLVGSGGLYAPTIRYQQGKFYIVCTNVIRGEGKNRDATENFIVSTDDIWSGTWSDPVYFEFEGIDPSLLFDDDGKVYLQGSGGIGPGTTINLFEIDLETGAKLTEEMIIWNGTGDIYPEGPHLYKVKGWYYLLIAEGGTHGGHMVTMARSQNVFGPYDSCPSNPVLTARGTQEYVQYTGHCELFQDKEGQWWGTCLGGRLEDQGRCPMGRETFLTRVNWEDDWPVFDQVKLSPRSLSATCSSSHLTAEAGLDYLYIRDAIMSNYRIENNHSSLTLTASSIDLSHPTDSPTFIGKRQRKLSGSSSVVLEGIEDSWSSAKIQAGLACYKEEHRFSRIYYDPFQQAVVLELVNAGQKIVRTEKHTLEEVPRSLLFRIEYTEKQYSLLYSFQPHVRNNWTCLGTVDTLDMTDPDFTGPIIGVYAVGQTEGMQVHFEGLSVE
ncbi:glycosyl hydrolase [Penicillium longicatenatum]|uniref:glycosyl hydrolase n=1 Tax=Penicillium longicatenatum TaxID=1561947 RepID=UPI002549B9A1|nr:glycosyl hydrolase [Penicillium longicatenatum]KAJ5636096.1 glycosyl hydrolase [Penicillium longicatenatum]